MTRNQKIIFGLWVGLPLLVMAVILVINPAYGNYYFVRSGPIYGASLIIGLQAINAFVLMVGFRYLKNHRHTTYILLYIVTLVLFTLPALWLAIYYPSIASYYQIQYRQSNAGKNRLLANS